MAETLSHVTNMEKLSFLSSRWPIINKERHLAGNIRHQTGTRASVNDKPLPPTFEPLLWEDNYFCVKDPLEGCNMI